MKEKGAGKKVSHVGIDIGTRFIKAAEISHDGNKNYELTGLYRFENPTRSTKEVSREPLKKLLDKLSPESRDSAISLSAPNALVRYITLPRMDEKELKKSLQFEAEKYIPYNINEVVIDCSILGQSHEDKNQLSVILAAAKKDIVYSRVEALKELGFSVNAIDIDAFSYFNAFRNSAKSTDEAKSIALLNFGYSQTNVIISKGAEPCFTRDIQSGTRDMVKLISQRMGLEEKEAEKAVLDPPENPADAAELSKSVLRELAEELRLSFGYYENQYGRAIDEIYVSGGASFLKGTDVFLEESFGIKPVKWNPFLNFKIGEKVDKGLVENEYGQFAVSAGLAMRV
ncbi:MAG: type IV pilus assembly protein PilM [Candidatus Omnitrophica bacterium]|nr:type IV pilus assembly protein PilM [Candidatus Omnitrophota bacterium]